MTIRNVRPFVHLRVLSSYSLGLGLSTPAEVCRHAARSGFSAVALTDVSGTYGFVEFHRAAQETGIKPIYGTLVFLDWNQPGHASEPVQSLIALALDRIGLRNVCAIASASAIRRERRDGLFIADLDGLSDGVVAIARVDPARSSLSAHHMLSLLQEMFGDRLFLECRAGLGASRRVAQSDIIAEAGTMGVATVLTQDIRFVGPARPQLFDLMASLDETGFEHRVFSDRRAGDAIADHGMLTAAELSAAYDEFPEAYTNASLIAALVQPDLFETLETALSPSATIEMFTADEALRTRVDALHAHAAASMARADAEVSRKRLDHELDLIDQAGLGPALLRFERLVRLLRESGVRLGPATGLNVQSRCAYLLGITTFDPYRVDARFEPVFDAHRRGNIFELQIAPDDRPAALAVVNRAFEGASIGYVPTVEHITAARAMRIVTKWQGTPPSEIEEAIKAATRGHGLSLRELAEDNRTVGKLYRSSAAFRELVAHAASIEGLPFGFARTKRTVIVSPRPLRDFLAHTVSPVTGDHFVQSTRDSFPLRAVLRIDLGLLRLLAIVPSDAAPHPVDPAAYALIAAGDLEGVHLLEGAPGRLAPSFGIRSLDDLVHFIALLRQRGSGMPLAQRLSVFRTDRQAIAAGERVGDILAPTNGWLLFRDQLRDVAAVLAGWTRAEAWQFVLRLSDHTPANLATLRREFFARTVEQSVPLDDATHWFTRLVRESGRAVNRQRVIAECLLIERCLAMKAAHPEDFLALHAAHTAGERRHELPARLKQTPPGEGVALEDRPEKLEGQTDLLASLSPGPGRADSEAGSLEMRPGRNLHQGFSVLMTVSEFYPHPTSTPVELAGRIRNLQTFRSSSDKKVGFFDLTDSSGSVRVFVPAEPLGRFEGVIQDGNDVVVRGTVRHRDGRKVCDALEIGEQGGNSLGQAPADNPSTGDS
jgi:DNA polymerase-3 subunit alpha